MTELVLYFAPGSSSMAVHIALHEVGASFEPRPMSFHKYDMRSSAFRAINPAGKVPTLIVDGRPLTEVAACLFYLAKRFPEAKLLAANDIEAEAQAVSWMSFIASTLHCLHLASGAPARRRACHRRMADRRGQARQAGMGAGQLLDRRYSPVSLVLAFAAFSEICTNDPARPFSSL